MTAHHVVILGAGAAGSSAARVLAGRDGVTTTLVGRTDEVPYTRMLVKGVAFGTTEPELVRLPLPPVDFVADTAERVDLGAREVHLASGARIAFDSLVVATGSSPRLLDASVPGAEQAARDGVLIPLHSLDDAARIRAAVLASGPSARIVIYGAGLTASETASALEAQGHQVSLVARSEVPGVAAFGRPVAERIAAEHSSRVSTFFGRTVAGIRPGAGATIVTLDDGADLPVDLVILALGTVPTGPAPWRDGLDVDDRLQVLGADGVLAAGGVSTHKDDHLGTWRVDHWEDGAAQGAHAARVLLHRVGRGEDPGPYRPRSAYLALVYGRMVSGVGHTGLPGTPVAGAEGLVVVHERGGVVVGASGLDAVGAVYGWGGRLHEAPA
ncbi:FAD-dependent oxidoreductase [Oerskovia turbata]